MSPTLRAANDTVLIVDVDVQASQTWAEGLRSCSPYYKVLTANSVTLARDLCHRQQIACVVLDLDMNGESGFEVLLDLVPDRHHPEIPVIVLTHLLSTTIQRLALDQGAQAWLVKERTSLETLDKAIQTAIASITISRPPASPDTTLLEELLRLNGHF